jgi:hypothetical protein
VLAEWRAGLGVCNDMLTLSFFPKGAAVPTTHLELADLRVSGATLWNPLDRGLLATYSLGCWKHRGKRYPRLAVTGGGCLLFGITRNPTIVSDPIDHYYFIGPTLSANGVAIAKYIEQQDMWQGMVRPMWWNAMRLLSVETVSAAVDESQVVLLNPWEPQPMSGGPPILDNGPAQARVQGPRRRVIATHNVPPPR